MGNELPSWGVLQWFRLLFLVENCVHPLEGPFVSVPPPQLGQHGSGIFLLLPEYPPLMIQLQIAYCFELGLFLVFGYLVDSSLGLSHWVVPPELDMRQLQ